MDTLDQYAPCNQKYTRGNHLPFMNKTILKEIKKRTRFWNQFLKNRTGENKKGTQNKATILSHSSEKQKHSIIVTLMKKIYLQQGVLENS